MNKLVEYRAIYYPESKFGGFSDIDSTVAFYLRVNSLIKPSSVVLDVGCGKGSVAGDTTVRASLRTLRGKCKQVIGIDVDEAARGNRGLDEFRLIVDKRWPVDGNSIDVCVCNHVLEHVEDPESFFSEARRAVKPAGYLCIRTPNALHYSSLFARLIPRRFHVAVLKKIVPARKAGEIYPAYYRCNTRRKTKSLLKKYGFDSCVYTHAEEPFYLAFSRFFYFLGFVYECYAPKALKTKIFAFGKKVHKTAGSYKEESDALE